MLMLKIELIFSLKRTTRASLYLENNTFKISCCFELNDNCLVSFYNMHFDFSQIPLLHLYLKKETIVFQFIFLEQKIHSHIKYQACPRTCIRGLLVRLWHVKPKLYIHSHNRLFNWLISLVLINRSCIHITVRPEKLSFFNKNQV